MKRLQRSIHAIIGYKSFYVAFLVVVFLFSNILIVSRGINMTSAKEVKTIKEKVGIDATITSSINGPNTNFPRNQLQHLEIRKQYLPLLKDVEELESISYLSYKILNVFYEGKGIVNPNNLTTDHFGNEMLPLFTTMGFPDTEFSFIKDNSIEIIEGRNFNENELEKGLNVGILFGPNIITNEKNTPISLGDSITIGLDKERFGIEANFDIKVIGFFEIDSLNHGELEYLENYIIVPANYLMNIDQEVHNKNEDLYENLYANMNVTDIEIKIIDVDNIEKVEKDIISLIDKYQIEGSIFELKTDSTKLDNLLKPLNNLNKVSSYSFYITLVSSAFIISLSSFYLIKKREKEIGTLLSMGETKQKIILQFLLEMIIVLVVALIITVPSSYVLFNKFATSYLANVGFSNFMILYLGGAGVVALSSIVGIVVTSIYIMKLRPKEILLK